MPGLSVSESQAIVTERLREHFAPESTVEKSLLGPTTDTNAIQHAVTAMARWYRDGLLVLREERQDGVLFAPEQSPQRLDLQQAFKLALACVCSSWFPYVLFFAAAPPPPKALARTACVAPTWHAHRAGAARK